MHKWLFANLVEELEGRGHAVSVTGGYCGPTLHVNGEAIFHEITAGQRPGVRWWVENITDHDCTPWDIKWSAWFPFLGEDVDQQADAILHMIATHAKCVDLLENFLFGYDPLKYEDWAEGKKERGL